MAINVSSLLPVLMKLRGFLEAGYTHALYLQSMGGVDPDVVAAFLQDKMDSWDPVVGGVHVLDDEGTKQAAARFLAGIGANLAKAAEAATRTDRSHV